MGRILYAASSMGHIKRFHMPYIAALRSAGHEVSIMASGDGADYNIPFTKKILSLSNVRCRKLIRKIIERERFDAVILNTSLAAYHIRHAISYRGRPWVVNIVHGYLFQRNSRGVKDWILLLAEKMLRKKTDVILTMNREDYDIATRYRLSREKPVMTLGMGAVCHQSDQSREQIRGMLSCEHNFVLCFVGELSKRKNQRLLIEALPKIKTKIPSAVLWLVGDGAESNALSRISTRLGVADSVIFLGEQDNPCDFIRAADIYVSASLIEGMPFNIIEALGTGIRVVASDIKGHRDLLMDGAGLLYSPNDREALVRCVLSVASDGVEREIQRISVYNKYSFYNVFSQTYKSILGATFGG